MQEFQVFKRKYYHLVDSVEKNGVFFDPAIRNLIIEQDDFDFLAKIASSAQDDLRNFYFNEETYPQLVQFHQFPSVLTRGAYFPNKIQLFESADFLKQLVMNDSCTHFAVQSISKELYSNLGHLEVVQSLVEGLYKYLYFLKQDFVNNFENIATFMEEVASPFYVEFLSFIEKELKEFAKSHKEVSLDSIFSNFYFHDSDVTFGEVSVLMSRFCEDFISFPLVLSLIDKSVDFFDNVLISEQELLKLREYVFNISFKDQCLNTFQASTLKKLYRLFWGDALEYFLDDQGIDIIYEAGHFEALFQCSFSGDFLAHSKHFLYLMGENFIQDQAYDFYLNSFLSSLTFSESFESLLDHCIELQDYSHFFRIFSKISQEQQFFYFQNRSDWIFSLENTDLFKGMKQKAYEAFGNQDLVQSFEFQDYDLWFILKNHSDYSISQLEHVFSNLNNVDHVASSLRSAELFGMILSLSSSKLCDIYVSCDFFTLLRKSGRLEQFYEIVDCTAVDFSSLLLDPLALMDIGEKINSEYQRVCIQGESLDVHEWKACFSFRNSIPRLKNTEVLFEILDFYLLSNDYLSSFYVLRNELDEDRLKQYFRSRRTQITRVIQEHKCFDVALILQDIPVDLLKDELFDGRENYFLHCNFLDYSRIVSKGFSKGELFSEKVTNDDAFFSKFIGKNCDLDSSLGFFGNSTVFLRQKISRYEKLREEIIHRLNDSLDEFRTYIQILMNSGIQVFDIEFLRDMMDVLFFQRRIPEVYSKYRFVSIEKKKLKILKDVIKASQNSIANSITNPLRKKPVLMEYMLENRKVVIPTVVYDGEPYTFLVRRMGSGEHFYNGDYQRRVEYYSTVTEKNRSVFRGDTGIKFGYVGVRPRDIWHVSSFDAISQCSSGNKYMEAYLKCPEWVSMQELNDRTFQNESYNELRIFGWYVPDFVLYYDQAEEDSIRYSCEHDTWMVKVLRKSYDSAVENYEDPYSHWQ